MSEMRSKSHQAINRLDLGLKSRVTLEMSCRLRDDLDSGTLGQDSFSVSSNIGVLRYRETFIKHESFTYPVYVRWGESCRDW